MLDIYDTAKNSVPSGTPSHALPPIRNMKVIIAIETKIDPNAKSRLMIERIKFSEASWYFVFLSKNNFDSCFSLAKLLAAEMFVIVSASCPVKLLLAVASRSFKTRTFLKLNQAIIINPADKMPSIIANIGNLKPSIVRAKIKDEISGIIFQTMESDKRSNELTKRVT